MTNEMARLYSVVTVAAPTCAACGHDHEGEHEYECNGGLCEGCAGDYPVSVIEEYGPDGPVESPPQMHQCICTRSVQKRVEFCPSCVNWREIKRLHPDAYLAYFYCEKHEAYSDW